MRKTLVVYTAVILLAVNRITLKADEPSFSLNFYDVTTYILSRKGKGLNKR